MNLSILNRDLYPVTDILDHDNGVISLCFGDHSYGLYEKHGRGFIVCLPGQGLKPATCFADAVRICRYHLVDKLETPHDGVVAMDQVDRETGEVKE